MLAPMTDRPEGPAPTLHEQRVEALLSLLADSADARLVEAHRRAMAAMRDDRAEGAVWYDRRLAALRRALEAGGLLASGEVEARLAQFGAEGGKEAAE